MFGLFGRKPKGPDRAVLADKAPDGPLKRFYQAHPPNLDCSLADGRFLALDFETTGLNPDQDEIISMGWVGIENGRIPLASARHQLVRPKQQIDGVAVTVHKIFDAHVAEAPPVEDVIGDLLDALQGRVLVAHHAPTEIGFLHALCRRLYGTSFSIPTIDTLDLGVRYFKHIRKSPGPGDLRLFNLRRRFGLPVYPAHNALLDALAAAELFLAITAHIDAAGRDKVSDFIRKS